MENKKQIDFMAQDLLRDRTHDEVVRLVQEVFGDVSDIKTSKKLQHEETSFEIDFMVRENSTVYPSIFTMYDKSILLTKFGFVDNGVLIPEGMLKVFQLLSKSVKLEDLEDFKVNFLFNINTAFGGQIVQETIKKREELERRKKEITDEHDYAVSALSEYMDSLREQLGVKDFAQETSQENQKS